MYTVSKWELDIFPVEQYTKTTAGNQVEKTPHGTILPLLLRRPASAVDL